MGVNKIDEYQLMLVSRDIIDWNSQEEFPYWDKESMIFILEGEDGQLRNANLKSKDIPALVDLILSDIRKETPAEHPMRKLYEAVEKGLLEQW